jgi:hypothetical protein
MATGNAHGLPLEYVQSGRKLNRLARPPFTFLCYGWPANFVAPTRHALTQFVLRLFQQQQQQK